MAGDFDCPCTLGLFLPLPVQVDLVALLMLLLLPESHHQVQGQRDDFSFTYFFVHLSSTVLFNGNREQRKSHERKSLEIKVKFDARG